MGEQTQSNVEAHVHSLEILGAGKHQWNVPCPQTALIRHARLRSKCMDSSPRVSWGSLPFFFFSKCMVFNDTQDIIRSQILLAIVQLYIPWWALCFLSDFCSSLWPWIKHQDTAFYFPLSTCTLLCLRVPSFAFSLSGCVHTGCGHRVSVVFWVRVGVGRLDHGGAQNSN